MRSSLRSSKKSETATGRAHNNTNTIPHTTVEIFLRFVVYEASVVLSVGYCGITVFVGN